jgi:subtilisin family serine protease
MFPFNTRVTRMFAAGALLVLCAAPFADASAEKVLVRAKKPYANLVQKIRAKGGKVTHQYKYVDALAVDVPSDALADIRALVGPSSISKDEIIPAPQSVDTLRGRAGLPKAANAQSIAARSSQALGASAITQLAATNPSAYLFNNEINNIAPLHAEGFLGQNVTVAVIDSGLRPGFPHIAGSVVGCDDFVGDALGCSNSGNNGHGTFVAGMISAGVAFVFAPTSTFRLAVLAECGAACFLDPPANTIIPMLGTAPLSNIYSFRVFPATGGAPTSRILIAVERVIDLKVKFDAGQPGGVNLQVCNMSLGAPTLFAGRDLFDTSVDVMIAKNIVPAIAAGNAGPATMTVGSPGTAMSVITVGAASLPHNERILRRVQFGPTIGALYRPFLGVQSAFFSSRGPDADGRNDPDVTANGFASFGQGTGATTTSISLGSGTSFATPSVSGIAAVLRQAHPAATAIQIRNAIIESANPSLLNDGSASLDQGNGYVDAGAADALLTAGNVSDSLPAPDKYNKSVKVNVEKHTDLNVRNGNVAASFVGLKPGQRQDILYRVNPNTNQVVVTLASTPALPPAQQNRLFGDDILLAIHSAKTSEIGEGDYQHFAFTTGGTFVVDSPETGIMRISVNGDWTNAGTISANVSVVSTTEPLPKFTAHGRISTGETLAFPITVPSGTDNVEFRTGWREDWGNYPTNDIDMIIIAPNGSTNLDGATAANPEVVSIDNPAAGQWLVLVDGFEVSSGSDKFEFRAALDGIVIKK